MKKNLNRMLLLFSTVSAIASCVSKTSVQTLDYPVKSEKLVFDKLVGTWKSEDGQSFERWSKYSNGTYHSSVYTLKGKDTIFMEQADIFKEKDRWIFENVVTGQNAGEKVRFTSAHVDENSVEFRNPEHDFPDQIHYTLSGANTVHAFIVGRNAQGGRDTVPFNYTRM